MITFMYSSKLGQTNPLSDVKVKVHLREGAKKHFWQQAIKGVLADFLILFSHLVRSFPDCIHKDVKQRLENFL